MYLFDSFIFVIGELVLEGLKLVPFGRHGLDGDLLLFFGLAHVVVFLADGHETVMDCEFLNVISLLGFLAQLVKRTRGGVREIVVSAWKGTYLTLLLMELRAGSLNVSVRLLSNMETLLLRLSMVLASR